MAESFKILGQLNPIATTLTDLYTAPASTSTSISTLVVANRSGTATTFRASVAVAGAADDPKQYLFYDYPVDGNASVTVTIGITLATSDKLRVYSGTGSLSYNVFGVEIT
jgi:hypothetical protein